MEVQVLVSSPPFELSDSSASKEEEQPTISPSNPSVAVNPWPFLENFFQFVEEKGLNNLVFQCQLCKPTIKKFSTSKKSQNNLKKHITRLHPNKKKEYQDALDNSRKRKLANLTSSNEAGEPSAKKATSGNQGKTRQTKITDMTHKSKQNDYEQKVS